MQTTGPIAKLRMDLDKSLLVDKLKGSLQQSSLLDNGCCLTIVINRRATGQQISYLKAEEALARGTLTLCGSISLTLKALARLRLLGILSRKSHPLRWQPVS